MRLRERRRDDEEPFGGEAGDRQIRLDAAGAVEKLSVYAAAYGHIDIGRRDAIQHAGRIATLHNEFGEGGLLEHADALAHRRVLLGIV